MEYRQLGASGVRVSAVGLGTNQFGGKVDQAGVDAIIAGALDLGINFIDTADVYTQTRSEETLGNALKGRWQQVVLATKGFNKTGDGPNDRGASRYHLINAVDASLKRLQSDHIDLYQIHRWDDSTPIDESLRALDDLVRSGKIRYIGASNFAAWQLARANLLAELRGMVAVCERSAALPYARTRDRARAAALLQRLQRRHPALLPAGRRLSHRQVQARPGCAGRLARRI